jgi:hypothetical protein
MNLTNWGSASDYTNWTVALTNGAPTNSKTKIDAMVNKINAGLTTKMKHFSAITKGSYKVNK